MVFHTRGYLEKNRAERVKVNLVDLTVPLQIFCSNITFLMGYILS